MTLPKAPLKQYLDSTLEEARVHRVWYQLQGRTARRRARRALHRWGALVVAVAVAVVVVAGSWLTRRDPGGLETGGGELPTAWTTPVGASQYVSLSDGSEIQLAGTARLEVLTNTGESFVTTLRRGKSSFDVRPGGPRQWVVECGLATVEVVGTRFTVERSSSSVSVAVQRGKVRVHGEGFDRTLEAGESATFERSPGERRPVRTTAVAPTASSPQGQAGSGPSAEGETSDEPAPAEVAPSETRAPPENQWDTLLARADAARRRGDRDAAVELLERVAKQAPDPGRRRLATFTLARLQLHEDPQRAAATLEDALENGVPRGLTEDALARLVEAYARAGDLPAARRTAQTYEQRYPHGRRASDVRSWIRRAETRDEPVPSASGVDPGPAPQD